MTAKTTPTASKGMTLEELTNPYEVRDEAPYFEDIPELKVPKEMLDLATHIVDTRSGHFDPSEFEDRYENALIDLLKKKKGSRLSCSRRANTELGFPLAIARCLGGEALNAVSSFGAAVLLQWLKPSILRPSGEVHIPEPAMMMAPAWIM
jgi:hypothetical protein